MQADNSEIINRILHASFISEEVKECFIEANAKINVSLLEKDWLVHLYSLRLEWVSSQSEYETIEEELRSIIRKMNNAEGKIYLLNVITSKKYLLVFLNEELTEMMGLLDLSGKGNTKPFMQ